MGAKIRKVNAFEAKTRLSELLRETEQGASYIICRRGKEVAQTKKASFEVDIESEVTYYSLDKRLAL